MRVGQICKRDRNEAPIVAALRRVGVRVQPINARGFADLVCWAPRIGVVLLEVKAPHGRVTPAQAARDAAWPVHIVRTIPDALGACGIRSDPPRCPHCGCYQFVYKGDKQVCRDCGRE